MSPQGWDATVAEAAALVASGEWTRAHAAEALTFLAPLPMSLAPRIAERWAAGEELEAVLAGARAAAQT